MPGLLKDVLYQVVFSSLSVSSARHAVKGVCVCVCTWVRVFACVCQRSCFPINCTLTACSFVLILTAFRSHMAELVSGLLCSFSPDVLTPSFTFISVTRIVLSVTFREFLTIALRVWDPSPTDVQLPRGWHCLQGTLKTVCGVFSFLFKNKNDHQLNTSSDFH